MLKVQPYRKGGVFQPMIKSQLFLSGGRGTQSRRAEAETEAEVETKRAARTERKAGAEEVEIGDETAAVVAAPKNIYVYKSAASMNVYARSNCTSPTFEPAF